MIVLGPNLHIGDFKLLLSPVLRKVLFPFQVWGENGGPQRGFGPVQGVGEREWKLKDDQNFLRSGGNFFAGDLGKVGYPSPSGRPVVLKYHCVFA